MIHPPAEGEFIRLYAGYQGDLFRYVAALIPHLQDAEDVLSEVTVVLWKQFDDFEQGTDFFAWARQIAYLRVLKYYRARDRRFVLPESLLEKLAASLESREEAADQRLAHLSECKKRLSRSDRELLDERYVNRQKVQDLAKRLNRSENSVSKSLGRIRRMLLACIERRIAMEKRGGRSGTWDAGNGHD